MGMIPIYRPYLTSTERKYVNECIASTWISSKGEFIERFERGFANFTGASNVTTVCNGTVALHLALLAIGIKAGDEIIVPTLTYVASANMIVAAGATPVFVDSLKDTWQVSPAAIEAAITPQTRAVMVVHLYGASGDMKAIGEICRKNGLLLIEDCAEAFGTYFSGKHVGTFGDVATFSFFGNKTITTGEGGMVIAKDVDVLKKAIHLKTQAVSSDREYWHDEIAYNYRMTNICAAIGYAQLEHAEYILQKKKQVARWYDQYLSDLPVKRQAEPASCQHSWWLYSILVKADLRDPLRQHLRQASIETRPVFPLVHAMPHFRVAERFPVAEKISETGLSLPSYPDLSESDVRLVALNISSFLEAAEPRGARSKISKAV
jgi:perosamine synthetase